jgi:pyrroline-5-carboxylate reductase
MSDIILLAGCGKMGGAMLEGWLERGTPPQDVYAVDPNPDTGASLVQQFGINVLTSPDDLPDDLSPGVVIFAVKPQMMDVVAPAYARFTSPDTVFLSIAAGKTIDYFESHVGDQAVIVRAMPNTPAAVRRGITVACPNSKVNDQQRQFCDDLLKAVGEVEWVNDEGMIDAVTALSGGGPAYVFLLAEVMAKAGRDVGLPDDLADKLARVTVSGAGELMHQSPESPDQLRINVTSPGGTTAEALRVLMADDAWQPLMTKAISAATARSKELAG